MIVYADVLIFLNLFVNFFIIKITSALCRENAKFGRMLLGAFLGGIFSLYIFLPTSGFLVESLFRFIISALIILTAFGFDSFKSFFRRVGVFFCASFLYAGCMLGLWTVLNLNRVIINNGVVYIDVSPILLITSTLVCYLIISVIRYFSKKHAFEGARCKIHIICKNKEVSVSTLVDTGHSLTDALTEKEVVIIEGGVAENLLTVLPDINSFSKSHNLPKGFRLLPYSSVGGSGLLPAFAPDEIWYERDGKKIKIKNVLLAISKEPLGEDYKAIISPTLLNK